MDKFDKGVSQIFTSDTFSMGMNVLITTSLTMFVNAIVTEFVINGLVYSILNKPSGPGEIVLYNIPVGLIFEQMLTFVIMVFVSALLYTILIR